MTSPQQFGSTELMRNSSWLKKIKQQFSQDQWPLECQRCRDTEKINGSSIRLYAIDLDENESQKDYLQVAGILDNICNAACQMCGPDLSTKIGSLISPTSYPIFDNYAKFQSLPQDQILYLDINGGEPSASKNYKHLLNNLPPNLKSLRVNTNCALMIPKLNEINSNGIDVTVTVSFDGIENVHDYVRWPVKWDKFYKNLMTYKSYQLADLNLWTTVSVLNINDLENIFNFVDHNEFNHSFALLDNPSSLNVCYSNVFTQRAKEKYAQSTNPQLKKLAEIVASDKNNQTELDTYIAKQDSLRNIKISNFII
jgi:sulfatase maturation enzyme AslB (radical SAM superfamily)